MSVLYVVESDGNVSEVLKLNNADSEQLGFLEKTQIAGSAWWLSVSANQRRATLL